ncbi:MAG: GNAT family N-acetyltransferase [Verrucomicrobia bacterium]|nr:GNAT family N-acetyltransferase [Verrucomicrobiota bacterium]
MNKDSGSSWYLRPVGPADGAFLFRLYATTRAEELAAWGWPPAQQEMFLQTQFIARSRGHAAAYPAARGSIILQNEIAVGTCLVSEAGDHVHLVNLALLPEHRGAGLGRSLIESLQSLAAETGRPLRLTVANGNRALRLYARLGFIVTSQDEVNMRMEWRAART